MLFKQPTNSRHREQFPNGAVLPVPLPIRAPLQEPQRALRPHYDRPTAPEPPVPTQTSEGTTSTTNSSSQYY